MGIKGNIVLITGGCGGMGREIGQQFASLGKKVVLVDINVDACKPLAESNPNILTIQANISDPKQLEALVQDLGNQKLMPDILVNGAGASPKYGPDGKPWTTWTMPYEHWRDIMRINIDAAFNICRLLLPHMIAQRYGRIVNIASQAARTGGAVAPVHYISSKAAMLGLTKGIAKEVGKYGITVNAVNPGRIDTPMIHDVSDEVNREIASRIPVGRLGLPSDIANAIAFLCADETDFLTGTTIEVNGGAYMGP